MKVATSKNERAFCKLHCVSLDLQMDTHLIKHFKHQIPYFGYFSMARDGVLVTLQLSQQNCNCETIFSQNLQENGFLLCQDLGNMT